MFNGQGINVKDVDERKDIIGGAWVMPISGMRLGAFGWEGSYARKAGGQVVSLRQHRYALSAEYKKGDLQLRTEYIHSTGRGFATTHQSSANASDLTIKTYTDKYDKDVANDKADGIYALAIVPVMVMPLPRSMAVRDSQLRNASFPIMVHASGTTTLVSPLQLLKARSPSVVKVCGRSIAPSAHPSKASLPIPVNLVGKLASARLLHCLKTRGSRTLTPWGTSTLRKFEQFSKADSPIMFKPSGNSMLNNWVQSEKAPVGTAFNPAGRTTSVT